MGENTSRKYRVEIEVPRVARAGETAWRCLAVKDTYSDVGDVADYLVESMVLAGIPLAMARGWVKSRLRCVPVETRIVSQAAETMPLGA